MIRASSAAASSIWCVAITIVLPAKRCAINSRKPRAAKAAAAAERVAFGADPDGQGACPTDSVGESNTTEKEVSR